MKRRFALGALIAAVALAVFGAGAALAAFPPTINLTTPPEGAVWKKTSPTDLHVAGTADTDDGDQISRVVVVADSSDGANRHYGPYVQTYEEGSEHESFDLTVFPDHNGKYRISVFASGRNCNFIGCGSETNGPTVVRNVTVAWPPLTPAGVKATLKDGTVTLEWDANKIADEPDLLGYIVERAVGGGGFSCFRTVAFDEDDPDTYKTTEDVSKQADNTFKYRVKAVRKSDAATEAPTCAKLTGIHSPASEVASVAWDNPAPDPTTTTTRKDGDAGGGGGTGGGAGGTTQTTRRGATTGSSGGRAPSRPNLSALGSLGVPTNLARPPGARPEADSPFNELLPFGSEGEAATEGGVALPQDPTDASGDDDTSTTTLLFVAAGLLATVLSAHVLWLKAQVDKMPLEPLVPEDVPLGG